MRKIIIILLITSSFYTFSQSLFNTKSIPLEQTKLTITYSLEYQQDSTNPYYIKQEDMLLFLGNDISLFLSKNSYNLENKIRNMSSQIQLQQWIDNTDLNSVSSRFVYRIFKNHPKGQLTHNEKVQSNFLTYEEDLKLFNWQLMEDTTSIRGYKVQKAICDFGGRSWIAWFCSEIPYNDGPYKFNGLPGLIVKINDTRNHYIFELKSIEQPEQGLMIEMTERPYIKTSKKDFFNAKDAFRDNIISIAKEAGFKSKAQQRIAINMSERNNPIELKRK